MCGGTPVSNDRFPLARTFEVETLGFGTLGLETPQFETFEFGTFKFGKCATIDTDASFRGSSGRIPLLSPVRRT
jgi:hypothetical protein